MFGVGISKNWGYVQITTKTENVIKSALEK